MSTFYNFLKVKFFERKFFEFAFLPSISQLSQQSTTAMSEKNERIDFDIAFASGTKRTTYNCFA